MHDQSYAGESIMIKLFEVPPSGNCHKVRLMLSLLGQPYDSVPVDMPTGAHKSETFLAKNPFGQVPVLEDGDTVLRDSQAILVYLARRYGNNHWLPQDPVALAQVIAWLSTAANEITRGTNAIRLHFKFGAQCDMDTAIWISNKVLGILETHLCLHDWLVLDCPTIADVAVYPYVALAPEAHIDLGPYLAIRAWFKRIQALPGYVSMPGMHIEQHV